MHGHAKVMSGKLSELSSNQLLIGKGISTVRIIQYFWVKAMY